MKRVYYTYVGGKLCRVEDYGAKKVVTEVRDSNDFALALVISLVALFITILALILKYKP